MKQIRPKHNPSKLHEDRLLEGYWKDRGGSLYTEVRIGMGAPGNISRVPSLVGSMR
jgi:hypothetical protein